MNSNCILCRAPTPSSDEDHVKQLHPWVKKKKAWAQSLMAQHYRDGKGVKQSYEMAKMLYEQAAEQGFTSAMVNLGVMYYNGEGVVRDMAKAKEWWTKAAAHGLEEAIKNLKLKNCS